MRQAAKSPVRPQELHRDAAVAQSIDHHVRNSSIENDSAPLLHSMKHEQKVRRLTYPSHYDSDEDVEYTREQVRESMRQTQKDEFMSEIVTD